jgi:ATP adenylyltransferase
MTYIKSANDKNNGCVFCLALEQEDSEENLIVYRGEHAFVILNRYPYTSGHLMVLPFAHVPRLDAVDAGTRGEMMELVNKGSQVLEEVYGPEGFNLGANLGAAAGAGIEEHVHLHVVPRWVGDTNFMSTVGETRVLPEELPESWAQMQAAWKK